MNIPNLRNIPSSPTLRAVNNHNSTRTVTIPASDLADLLQATLILANGFRPSAKARLTWMATFARISAQTSAQLPKGGQP